MNIRGGYMRYFKWFLLIILVVTILLTGCLGTPSIELISSSAEIRDDRSRGIGIMSGERKGEVIYTTSLSYDFVLKNTGNRVLGGVKRPNKTTFGFDDGIKASIEPNEKLLAIVKEVMGCNIFEEEDRMQNHLGIGTASTPVLAPGMESKFTFDFVLGATEENPEIRLVPSQEQLDKLERNSMEATLVIHIEDNEIARFDLAQLN